VMGRNDWGIVVDDLRGPWRPPGKYPTKRDNKPISKGNFCEDTGV
jgi:hypothetical protein